RDGPHEVCLRPRLLHGWCNHLARRHLEVANQTLGPVTLVLELAPLLLARLHRFGASNPLHGLDSRHLVHADGVDVRALQRFRCRWVPGTNRLDLLLELCRVLRLRIEPVAAAMRLEFGRILKNARLGGRKSTRRCRVSSPRRPTPRASRASPADRWLRAAHKPPPASGSPARP